MAFNEGLEEYRGGNSDLAAEKFRQAIELDPEMTNGYLMLGSIALNAGDPTQASALASTALETDPGNTNALMIRYDAARQLGDSEGARMALDALLKADPEWAATDLFNHAVELYNGDEMASAATALEKVVELQPDDAKARFLLGMAMYNIGDPVGAKKHLTKFIELAPDDPDAELAREMLKYATQ
jgi:tetratricopeptide (TPR) repeat protein